MIHEEPVVMAGYTEALAEEEALTENSEAPVESFFYLQGTEGSFDCDSQDLKWSTISSCKVDLEVRK